MLKWSQDITSLYFNQWPVRVYWVQVISEPYYKGTILQKNYMYMKMSLKMTMTTSWSFSCKSFVKFLGKKIKATTWPRYTQSCALSRCFIGTTLYIYFIPFNTIKIKPVNENQNDRFSVKNKYIWAATCDFQQCGICDQQSLRSACAYAQPDQSLC